MTHADARVVYLGGLGRSGSTLVERLLAELPDVCAAGEVVHMWRRGVVLGERCGCGDQFGRCEFWAQVGKEAFGGWDEVDVERVDQLRGVVDRTRFIPQLAGHAMQSSMRRALDEYTSYYVRVYSAITEVSGSPLVIDSSKHASLAYCLASRPEIDLRVIHVVRDSRAVAYSWTTHVTRPDSDTESYMARYSPVGAAGHWNTQNGALQMLARVGTPTLRIRYEDLVQEPAASLRIMAEFAGLPAARLDLSFLGDDGGSHWAQLHEAHTASGNPMRFTTGKINIRGDERWRTAMSATHRRTVTALTLPLLTHYGYVGRAA